MVFDRVEVGSPPGVLRRAAVGLGFDRALAQELAETRPEDVVRWAKLGYVPAEEDPRS